MKNQSKSKNIVLATVVTSLLSSCLGLGTSTTTPPVTTFVSNQMTAYRATPVAAFMTPGVSLWGHAGVMQTVAVAAFPAAGTTVSATDLALQMAAIKGALMPTTALSFANVAAAANTPGGTTSAPFALVMNAAVAASGLGITPVVTASAADQILIDQSVITNPPTVNMRVLGLNGGNILTIRGNSATALGTAKVNVGTLISTGATNAIAISNGGHLVLDSGRLAGTIITAHDASTVTFAPFVDTTLFTNPVKSTLFIGDSSGIVQNAAFEILAGQTVTLDNLKFDATAGTAGSISSAVSIKNFGTLVVTNGTLTAPTITNMGALTVTKGTITGNFVNGDGTVAATASFQSGTIVGTGGAGAASTFENKAKSTFNMFDISKFTAPGVDTAANTVIALNTLKTNHPLPVMDAAVAITNSGKMTFSGGAIGAVTNATGGTFTMADTFYNFSKTAINAASDATTATHGGTSTIAKDAIAALASTSTAGAITNSGKFIMSGGTAASIANTTATGVVELDGGTVTGAVQNTGGGTVFNYLGKASATIGSLESIGLLAVAPTAPSSIAGNTINLQSSAHTLSSAGGVTVDKDTVINFGLNNAGSAATSAAAVAVVDAGATAVHLMTSKLVIFGATGTGTTPSAIVAGTKWMLIKTTGGVTLSTAATPVVIDTSLLTAAGGAPTLGTDLQVALDGNGMVVTALTALKTSALNTNLPFTLGSRIRTTGSLSSQGMMGAFSGDMNAITTNMNGLSMTTSADAALKTNFVGASFNTTSASKLGAYVGYSEGTSFNTTEVNELGVFASAKFGSFNVVNSVAYGANESHMVDGAAMFNTSSKSVVAQAKTSYALDAGSVSFIPNFVVGYGQLMSQEASFVRNAFQTFNVSAGSGSVFGGLGLDIVSKFTVATYAVQAFASLNVSSELSTRQFTVAETAEVASINGTTANFMVGGKVAIDNNSSFYATAQAEKAGDLAVTSKFAAGMNFKL